MRLHQRIAFLLVFSSLATAGQVVGSVLDSVLADGGEIYTIQSGLYEDLFPGEEGHGNEPILAVDLAGPAQEPRRFLVEGSQGPDTEGSARLVYEGTTGVLYVLWESRQESGDLAVRLVALRDFVWSDPIEINAGSPLAAPPQLVLTRDSFVTSEQEGEVRTVVRTVLHLAWVELSHAGSSSAEVIYSPAILEDGEYLGSAPRVSLSDLDPSIEQASQHQGDPRPAGLTLEAGLNSETVVATFLNPASDRVVTTEIRVLPGELADVARSLSRGVVEEGGIESGGQSPGNLEALAGGVGGMVIDIGWALHGSLRHYLSAQVEISILDGVFQGNGPGIVLQNLADGVGGMVIDIGSRVILSGGLDREILPERRSIVRVPRLGSTQAEGSELAPLHQADPFHLLHLYVVADRPAPETGENGLTFLSSRSGHHGLVCWETAEGQLRYRETTDGEESWTEVQSLTLDENLSLERAHEILRERVRRR